MVIETIQPRPGNGMTAVAAPAASWGVLDGAVPAAAVQLPSGGPADVDGGARRRVRQERAPAGGQVAVRGDWFDRKKDDGRRRCTDRLVVAHEGGAGK